MQAKEPEERAERPPGRVLGQGEGEDSGPEAIAAEIGRQQMKRPSPKSRIQET